MRHFYSRFRTVFIFTLTLALVFSGLVFFASRNSVHANNTYFPLTAGTPFTQNWTNAGLITTNDDWSGVPSIEGFRGDGLAAATAVDPQTITAADDPGVIDVNANQTNPTTFATGGVTEFAIADPVVAIFGSGTARAPYLRFYLDTSGCNGAAQRVRVQYNLRDIDASTDNSVQPVALQYRVGASGVFTNVPSAFVADASGGPSTATTITPVNVLLPSGTTGVPQLQMRVMTSDAVGNDEAIGVDDINVTCESATAANSTLSGRVLGRNGQGVANARVQIVGGNFIEPVFALTNPFGYYSFTGLPSGQTYVVSATAKGMIFDQPTQLISLNQDMTEVNFSPEGK